MKILVLSVPNLKTEKLEKAKIQYQSSNEYFKDRKVILQWIFTTQHEQLFFCYGVVLKIYFGSQIPVTTRFFEL